ncbi:hypothetical protein [Deinococcus knuensis]|uniref:hypothetical protein n=1 Tax=Deinococcus knuensis TaxID=1837380 RepID=UPI0016640C89|nr:hypothetical protein [Deinococcus knuensis]
MSAQVTLPVLTPGERLRLHELEEQVIVGTHAGILAGRALKAIQAERLYRAQHDTFEAYGQARFNLSRARLYQLIDFATIHDEARALDIHVSSERMARALGLVPPDDYQLVLDVTRSVTGKDRPSSADVQAVADTVRDLAAGAHVEHPDTGQSVPLTQVPPERRVEAVARAARRGAQDRTRYQGATPQGQADDVRPLDWADGLRAVADVELRGTGGGWQLTLTDRSSGERREGPERSTVWDAIRHARSAWEGERP